MFFTFVLVVVPNSDNYLSQRYPKEFPAYAAHTATLIPGLHSKVLSQVLAWLCLLLCIYSWTPKQDGKSRSEEEDEEHDTKGQVPPTTKKPTDRGRGSKRPPTHESDPTVSPTTGRGRKRQTLSSDAVPETEEAKDREIRRLQQELADQKSQMQNLHVLANKGRTLLAQSLVDIAKIEREKERTRLFHEGVRVGKYKPSLAFGQADGWEGGTEKEAIEQLKAKLNQELLRATALQCKG
eukprot:g32494.t1